MIGFICKFAKMAEFVDLAFWVDGCFAVKIIGIFYGKKESVDT